MKVSNRMPAGRRVLAGAFFVAAIGALVGLLAVMNRPVQVVRVMGDLSAAERDAVKAVVLERLDGGLLGIDLDHVVSGVLALSWPREVTARRVWPGIVEVHVTTDSVAARWGAGGVLNSAGEVIEVAGEPDPKLPLIRCANANGARAMQIFQMLDQVLAGTPLKIAEVDEDALGEWQVRFTNDATVSLGHEDLLERVGRFYKVYRFAIDGRLDRVDHIDARYRNGVAVSWRAGEGGNYQLAMATSNGVVR